MKLKMYFIKYSWLLPIPFGLLVKFYPKKIIFPFYHMISDVQPNYIKHLYMVKSINDFKKDMLFVLKYFDPISVVDFVKYAKGEFCITKNSFLLSFDDGLSSLIDIVPFLIENKIPALFFLNSEFVNNKGLFYRYKVSLLIDEINKNKISNVEMFELKRVIQSDFNNKNELINLIKQLTHKSIIKIDKIAAILGFSFEDFLFNEQPYLNEKQINILIENGFYFGGHSCSHESYQMLNEIKQIAETLNSVDFVKSKFKSKFNFFSFPFSDDDVSLKFFKKMEAEEVISFGTAGLKDESIDVAFNFQRIPMEYSENYSAKSILKGELIYYLIKKILGKNIITRS